MSPDVFACGIEPQRLVVMSQRLFRETVLLTPGGKLRLRSRRISGFDAAIEIFADHFAEDRVVLNLLSGDFGTLPFSSMSDKPHQSACQRVRRVILHCRCQVLRTLGRLTVCFVPESEPGVGIRVVARAGPRRLVVCKTARATLCGRPIRAEQSTTHENRVEHRAPLAKGEEREIEIISAPSYLASVDATVCFMRRGISWQFFRIAHLRYAPADGLVLAGAKTSAAGSSWFAARRMPSRRSASGKQEWRRPRF